MSCNGRQPIIVGYDIWFITDIGATVTRDDHCAGVAIKFGVHIFQWGSLDVILRQKAWKAIVHL